MAWKLQNCKAFKTPHLEALHKQTNLGMKDNDTATMGWQLNGNRNRNLNYIWGYKILISLYNHHSEVSSQQNISVHIIFKKPWFNLNKWKRLFTYTKGESIMREDWEDFVL